jgi:hypothetical protein
MSEFIAKCWRAIFKLKFSKLEFFKEPLRQTFYRRRWLELPAQVQTDAQLAGVAGVACGATHGIMEKCNFSCTSCYLSEAANWARPLPFEQVQAQLDHLRQYLGSGGKVQITSGEVTLLPKDELGRIVAYARGLGLDPMVMTNGQRFLQDPAYLPYLVERYGLEKVSFHVDSTQKGRPGWRPGMAESEVDPIRERLADLVRLTRRTSGKNLHAAHTVTLTPDNVESVADIVAWTLDNCDAIRLLSFLPVAEVGRTRDRRSGGLDMEGVWRRICNGAGKDLNRDAMLFGHPECNITVPLLVLGDGRRRRLVEVVRRGRGWDRRAWRLTLRRFAVYTDLNAGVWHNVKRLLLPLLRQPHTALELAAYAFYRLCGEFAAVWAALRSGAWRPKPLLLVVHRFMGAEELDTPLGRERLEACVFKLPVGDRMVPMCEMNATPLRHSINVERSVRSTSSASSA